MVVMVAVVISLGRGSSAVDTGLQDDAVCDRVVGHTAGHMMEGFVACLLA